jgi:hypothetical protein
LQETLGSLAISTWKVNELPEHPSSELLCPGLPKKVRFCDVESAESPDAVKVTLELLPTGESTTLLPEIETIVDPIAQPPFPK